MERMNSGAINVHWHIGSRDIDIGLVPRERQEDFIRSLVDLLEDFAGTTENVGFTSNVLADAELAVSFYQLDELHAELLEKEELIEKAFDKAVELEDTIETLRGELADVIQERDEVQERIDELEQELLDARTE